MLLEPELAYGCEEYSSASRTLLEPELAYVCEEYSSASRTLLEPELAYGCEEYSSASRTLLESFNPIQNLAIRIATGAIRSSIVDSLHVVSGVKPQCI